MRKIKLVILFVVATASLASVFCVPTQRISSDKHTAIIRSHEVETKEGTWVSDEDYLAPYRGPEDIGKIVHLGPEVDVEYTKDGYLFLQPSRYLEKDFFPYKVREEYILKDGRLLFSLSPAEMKEVGYKILWQLVDGRNNPCGIRGTLFMTKEQKEMYEELADEYWSDDSCLNDDIEAYSW